MPVRLTRDQTFKVLCNLRTPVGQQETVGTGMFVVDGEDQPFLLTASHVAVASTAQTRVVLSDASSNAVGFPLTDFDPSLDWTHHGTADIAVLRVSPGPKLTPHLNGRFFPLNQISRAPDPPSRDAYLTAVGFPNGLGAAGKFSPFTFRSHASSALVTLPRFDNQVPCDFFTLENPSVGGYSGGPVFDLGYIIVGAMTTSTGPTICHGVMHGTIGDQTGGKIAAVTPGSYVHDLI